MSQRILSASIVVVAGILAMFSSATGRETGIVGFSGKGGVACSACHFSAITPPEVTLSGPAFLRAGESGIFTLTMIGGNETAGGLNVAVDDGTLAVVQADTRLESNEITHVAPQLVNGDLDNVWDFEFTAPVTAGIYTIYGAGNSVDDDGFTIGDVHDTDTLDVDVRDNLVTFADYGAGTAGTGGLVPSISGSDGPIEGGATIEIRDVAPSSFGFLWLGFAEDCLDGLGGKFLLDLSTAFKIALPVDGSGSLDIPMGDVSGFLNVDVYAQYTALDGGAPKGVSFSNGTKIEIR